MNQFGWGKFIRMIEWMNLFESRAGRDFCAFSLERYCETLWLHMALAPLPLCESACECAYFATAGRRCQRRLLTAAAGRFRAPAVAKLTGESSSQVPQMLLRNILLHAAKRFVSPAAGLPVFRAICALCCACHARCLRITNSVSLSPSSSRPARTRLDGRFEERKERHLEWHAILHYKRIRANSITLASGEHEAFI